MLIRGCRFDLSNKPKGTKKTKKLSKMNTKEIKIAIKEKGMFSASNEVCGWYAISRDGINMIQFRDDKIKFYTEDGFAKKVISLLNKGC